MYNAHPHFWSISISKRIKNIYIDKELALPMYNAHPYFPLKNLGEKVCIILGKIQYLPKTNKNIHAHKD